MEDYHWAAHRQLMQTKRQFGPSHLHKCSSILSVGRRQLSLPASVIMYFEKMPKPHYYQCGVNSDALLLAPQDDPHPPAQTPHISFLHQSVGCDSPSE